MASMMDHATASTMQDNGMTRRAGRRRVPAAGLKLTPEGIAVLDYRDLASGAVDLADAIHHAYGFDGAGLLVVEGVPGFADSQMRRELLGLAHEFANLPEEAKARSERPDLHYSFGWSHGKERLENGELDKYKGSFYNNPQYDVPTLDPALIASNPDSYSPNVWPDADLPQLRPAFKALGQLIVGVGEMVARESDHYVESQLPQYRAGTLEHVIRESRTCKARLLYYFPFDGADDAATGAASPDSNESWCGWHNDHGALTGLTPAMFIDADSGEFDISSPEPESGLYAKTRAGNMVQVKIPRDAIAFQIGECAQVLTGGLLRATPHAVRALSPAASTRVARATFACFMQPDGPYKLDVPAGIPIEGVAVGQYAPGQTFSDFHLATIAKTHTD